MLNVCFPPPSPGSRWPTRSTGKCSGWGRDAVGYPSAKLEGILADSDKKWKQKKPVIMIDNMIFLRSCGKIIQTLIFIWL